MVIQGVRWFFTGSEANGEDLNSESSMCLDRFVTNDFGGPRNKASGVDFDFSEQKKKKTLQVVG